MAPDPLSLSLSSDEALCSSRYPRQQPVGADEGGGHSWLNRGEGGLGHGQHPTASPGFVEFWFSVRYGGEDVTDVEDRRRG